MAATGFQFWDIRVFILVLSCASVFLGLGFLLAGSSLVILWCVIAPYIFGKSDGLTAVLPEKKCFYEEKVVWVTGASSGIGAALCQELALRGCSVILSSRNPEELKTSRDSCIDYAVANGRHCSVDNFLILPIDMSSPSQIEDAVPKAQAWRGHVDYLFNNAGISSRGTMLPYATCRHLLEVDLMGPILLTKLVLPYMEKLDSGSIVFTNSIQGRIFRAGKESYCVAKSGLLAFAEILERECRALKIKVAVTSIMAGYVQTSISGSAVTPAGIGPKCKYVGEKHMKGLLPCEAATLILRGVSNELQECWISKNPELMYLYLGYYVPSIMQIATWLMARKHVDEVVREIEDIKLYEQRSEAKSS